MRLLILFAAGGFFLGLPGISKADDEDFEFWLNPSVSTDLDDNTGIEFETAQRFRSSSEGRADTYFGRLWIRIVPNSVYNFSMPSPESEIS